MPSALPVDSLRLDLDALAKAGQRWQQSLERQQGLTQELARQRLDPPCCLALSRGQSMSIALISVYQPSIDGTISLQIWKPGKRSVPPDPGDAWFGWDPTTSNGWLMAWPGRGGPLFSWSIQVVTAKDSGILEDVRPSMERVLSNSAWMT